MFVYVEPLEKEGGDVTVNLSLAKSYRGDALSEAKAAFGTAASAMLEGLDADMEEAERERILHDRLVGGVVYDTTLSKADIYNAYGALVNGTAVCEGYARAMQYLLYQAAEACWDFIDWWTTADVQYDYSNSVENIMGPAGRRGACDKAYHRGGEGFNLL